MKKYAKIMKNIWFVNLWLEFDQEKEGTRENINNLLLWAYHYFYYWLR